MRQSPGSVCGSGEARGMAETDTIPTASMAMATKGTEKCMMRGLGTTLTRDVAAGSTLQGLFYTLYSLTGNIPSIYCINYVLAEYAITAGMLGRA